MRDITIFIHGSILKGNIELNKILGLTPKPRPIKGAQIGAWKCNLCTFPALGNYDRPTNQQTDMRGHR